MHRLLKLTSLLLCFELILGPVAPGFSFVSKAMAQDCPGGTQFDSTLNRCITTEQMANIMNATSNCSPSDKECYKANAERALKEGEEEGKIKEQLANKGGLMGTGMKVAAVAVPLFMVMKKLFRSRSSNPNPCPTSPSVYIMLGAGAAVFIGDMFANSKHKKRLKKIKEEWEGIRKGEASGDKGSGEKESEVATASLAQTSSDPDVRNAQAKESQAEAFEMLAKSEDSLASAAKFKSTIYAVGALAFAGASVLSFIEASKPWSQACPGAASGSSGSLFNDPSAEVLMANQVLKSERIEDFFTLHYGFERSLANRSSPSIDDYEEYKKVTKDYSSVSQDVMQFLKAFAVATYHNLNILPSAHADPYVAGEGVDSQSQAWANQRSNSNILAHGNSNDAVAAAAEGGVATAAESGVAAAAEGGVAAAEGGVAAAAEGGVAAAAEGGVAGAADGAAAAATDPGPDPRSFLEKPIPRGIIAGVFAAWAGLMFLHAKKQASISKARAKYLRDRKDEFNDATGAISCTAADRNNVNNLKCYCYNSSGQRNTQRTNSQACIALFTGRNVTGETNYLNGTGIASQRVCMTNAGIDENCACRTNNTCLSAVPSNFSGINPGTLGLISSSTSPLNQLTSGQIAAGSVNGAAAVSNALKLLDQAKKSQAKVPQLANGKGDKLARNLAGSVIASSAGGSAPQLSSPSSGSPFNLSPSQAAASLEKEFKDAETGVASVKSGGFVSQPGPGKVDDFGLEFGMTPTQLAADQNTLSQMNQNLDFGQNDINNSSTTNLFEVLSNRYQRSGMRRLFDDEGKMAADPAAKTDITE